MYSAVIIETREHKALSFVLLNFLKNLSDEWNFIIFHGNLNLNFINSIIENELQIYKHRITLVHIQCDNLLRDDYSKLLVNDKIIYDNIPTETFLIFQTDTVIFEQNKHLINNFLKYDYVGAYLPLHDLVGNGGLSLRKKSKMLEIINAEDEDKKRTHTLEDLFFSETTKVNVYKPDKLESCVFAIENAHFYDQPFGCHKPWNDYYYKNGGINSHFCQLHPEILELYKLNQ